MKSIMKNIKALSILFSGILVAAASCVKITEMNDLYRPVGSPIVFTATTGYENGLETKAEYSGQLYGSAPSYERIDWVSADPIDIIYNSGTPNSYSVTSVDSPTDEKSYASISGGSLRWADVSTHRFYALYPAGSHENGTLSYTTNGVFVEGLIPDSQPVDANHKITPTSGVDNGITKYQPDTRNYGYLVAYKEIGEESAESTVQLPFRPAMTTFEFRFRTDAGNDMPKSIASFVLSTEAVGSNPVTPLAGTFKFKIAGGDERGASWVKTVGNDPATSTKLSSTSNSITVTFPTGGVPIPKTGYLDFSILALPIDITGASITINYTSGDSKTLKLKDNMTGGDTDTGTWHTFLGAKKYVITNIHVPGGDYIYIVEEIQDFEKQGHLAVTGTGQGLDFTVKSYRYPEGTPPADIASVAEAVPWKVQYSFYNEVTDTWSDFVDLPGGGILSPYVANSAFNFVNYNVNPPYGTTGIGSGVGGASYSTGEPRTTVIMGNTEATLIQGTNPATETLRARAARGQAVGTGNGPFDLSKHPFYGSNIDGSEGNMNTANTYVVTAPGYYMFPCVYGNAIMNGQPNVSAYNPGGSSAQISGESFTELNGVQTNKNKDWSYYRYYTPRFYNAANKYITDPYIIDDLASYGTVGSLDAVVVWQDTPANSLIIPYDNTHVGTTTVGGIDYIWFKIDSDKIQPGNIMIALRGTVAGEITTKSILWSWQIWITEKDLAPTDAVTNAAGSFQLMPYNLGWVDAAVNDIEKYPTRSIKYRVVQVDALNDELPIDPHTGDDETFIVRQVGEESPVASILGNNPYYQWGRKDPMLPLISSTKTKTVTPNPDYSALIPSNGSIPPAAVIGSNPSPDYSVGIQNPYLPLANLIDIQGHGSTSWVGGTYYPWFKTDQNRTQYNAWKMIHPGDPNYGQYFDDNQVYQWVWVTFEYSSSDFAQEVRTDHYIYTPNGSRNYTINDVDRFVRVNNLNRSDFVFDGYTAEQRSNSSAVYNLWNSYIYQENVPYSHLNKYKTVYDPCPAGFAVPTNKVFLANTPPSSLRRGSNYHVEKVLNPSTMPTPTQAITPNMTPTGLNFGGMYFPFTGGRTFYKTETGAELRPNEASATFGNSGSYWTDNPFQIDLADDRISDPQDFINSFSFHHSAYMFIFYPNLSHVVMSITRGSAASIRPMVDPKYTGN